MINTPWYAAGVILVHKTSSTVLLMKRTVDNYWGIPGGKAIQGENPLATAIRELHEETKLNIVSPFHLLGDNNGFVVFARVVHVAYTPRLSYEHDRFIWAKPERLPEPLFPGFEPFIAKALAL